MRFFEIGAFLYYAGFVENLFNSLFSSFKLSKF